MVNFKTKFDKHENDDEKRRRSIKEKEKAKLNQSQIIKEALSNTTLNTSSNKKVVFSDEDDDGEVLPKHLNGKEKTELFDGSGSEDEKFEIKEKVQFGSKKGFELLNLQSTYGNDERFRIDERFLEDKKDEFEAEQEGGENSGKNETFGEKDKQLKILEGVLGQSVAPPESEKKAKKRTYEMVRYDASNKEHEKYEIKTQPETTSPAKKRKEKKERKKTEKSDVELPTHHVSKEKFYEVSNEIKNSFKEKKEEIGQFSLLQTYGVNGTNEVEGEKDDEEMESVDECETVEDNHIGASKSEVVRKEKTEVEKERVEGKGAVAKGIWKESFFFTPDDPRFKEGLEFINKKGSEEASEAAENYDKTRKILREILRLHVKKQLHKKDPFRNKIGGMNKKQLANSKLKNSKTSFNKRISPKVNTKGKI